MKNVTPVVDHWLESNLLIDYIPLISVLQENKTKII